MKFTLKNRRSDQADDVATSEDYPLDSLQDSNKAASNTDSLRSDPPEPNVIVAGDSPPAKTVLINMTSLWSTRVLKVSQDGKPTLWVSHKRSLDQGTMVNMHEDSDHGPIIAASRISCWAKSITFYIGNTDCTDPEAWTKVTRTSWKTSGFTFEVDGKELQWVRTRDKELGSGKLCRKNYKLKDGDGDGSVVAVFLNTRQPFNKGGHFGRLEWYSELGPEPELASLVVILAIQEKIRQMDQAAAASGGA